MIATYTVITLCSTRKKKCRRKNLKHNGENRVGVQGVGGGGVHPSL